MRVTNAIFLFFLAIAGGARAHVVPNITVEAEFTLGGSYTLRVNVDPRTFLAADPSSLPPVPASWYQGQTPEQVAATHAKAREYLVTSLGVLFNGRKTSLPACEIRAMDGADNTALKADTQEVHFLVTYRGQVPSAASSFEIEFGKNANTSLILLQSEAGQSEVRPQVVFPGETSRPFQVRASAADSPGIAPSPKTHDIYLTLGISGACIAVIFGWALLTRFRQYHQTHRQPRDGQM